MLMLKCFFVSSYWPEFSTQDLDDLISDFNSRERRFGGILVLSLVLFFGSFFKCINIKTT